MMLEQNKKIVQRLSASRFLLLALLILSSMLVRVGVPAPVAAADAGPFECEEGFFQTIGRPFEEVKLKKLNIKTKLYDTIGSTKTLSMNAVGWNEKDQYMYGAYTEVQGGPTYLGKIDKNGEATKYAGIDGSSVVAGAIYYVPEWKESLYMYISGSDKLNLFNIDTKTQLPPYPITGGNLGGIQDIVNVNGKIYGINGPDGSLFEITFTPFNGWFKGTVNAKFVYEPGGDKFGRERLPPGGPYGAAWATKGGEIYFSNNATGVIYKINGYTSSTPTYEIILDGEGNISANDGASCPYAEAPIKKRYNRPFLRVSGGDVRSGAIFGGSSLNDLCENNVTLAAKEAPIKTKGYYNSTELLGQNLWGSSSAQYGVFASGVIGSTSGTSTEDDMNFTGNDFTKISDGGQFKKSLLFANTPLAPPSDYGSFYGGASPPPCIDIGGLIDGATEYAQGGLPEDQANDYIQKIIGRTDGVDGAADRTKVLYKGDVRISNVSGVVARGSHLIVIDGDLTIDSGISYNPNAYENLDRMPNLTIVVLGKIDINSDVKYLDGTYIAYPKEPLAGDGVVDTCYDETSVLTVNSKCSDQLQITGRLIADSVLWKRTRGTVGTVGNAFDNGSCTAKGDNAGELVQKAEGNLNIDKTHLEGGCAAEYIRFSPEAYFNNVNITSTEEISNVPVSTKDLPPVY